MESKPYIIKVTGHNKFTDHVEYLLTITITSTQEIISFYERYSNLKTLNDKMKKEIGNSNFPKFPPKKFFGSDDETFLNRRQMELNVFFESISNTPELCRLNSLKNFIEEKIKTSNKNNIAPVKNTQSNKQIVTNPIPNINHTDNKKLNDDLQKIVKSYDNKFIYIGYVVDQDQDAENEGKYYNIFSSKKIFEKSIENSLIFNDLAESKGDGNEGLIGQKDENIIEQENSCREKLKELIQQFSGLKKEYECADLIIPV